MKLLIVTQKVNSHDPILGFFVAWIKEFSKYFESVTVICLEKGKAELPQNVHVLSLGKEEGVSRLKYLYRFFLYSIKERKNYDIVFVHMNPIYCILGGLLWRILGKQVGLWYTHKNVDLKLKLGVALSNMVFSASDRSFRYQTPKVHIMGHGIDTHLFKPIAKQNHEPFKIISVGRISAVKNQSIIVDVADLLKKEGMYIHVEIVGGPVTESDKNYKQHVVTQIEQLGLHDTVTIKDRIDHDKVASYVAESDLFMNLSETGSLDKAVLEAMSCEVPVVTSNEAFTEMLKPFDLMVDHHNPEQIALNVKKLITDSEKRKKVGTALRQLIEQHHNLSVLIKNIVNTYETSR